MRFVYDFGEGRGDQAELLGGKGAGLSEMIRLGLRVPPGFTVTTEACRQFLSLGRFPASLGEQVVEAVHRLEASTGRRFGGGTAPLLLSVRSGAAVSMPGMMDTVLDLGINEVVVKDLADWAGDDRFAWDAYRRFVTIYATVVLGMDRSLFEEVLAELRLRRGVSDDASLTTEDLREATGRFKAIVAGDAGLTIPSDPIAQLRDAVGAVFRSWNTRRAREYRRLHGLPDDAGTAANVQMMVFGQLGEASGTGVCFTRNPATGERRPYGDFLRGGQGEDVVAGIRDSATLQELEEQHPALHTELLGVMETLERNYRDMCDIEFTIERGRLWILQTRAGKRTAQASVRMAVEMAGEGLISRETAVGRVDPATFDQFLHLTLGDDVGSEPLAIGVAASPGAATGVAVFDADTAAELGRVGTAVILVSGETRPEDIHGMAASEGILTGRGGKTSHAAVVARGMGVPAVTGAGALDIDADGHRLSVDGTVVAEGDLLTIDGSTGRIFAGSLPLTEPAPSEELSVLLEWADGFRRMRVRANADNAEDARRARERGAEGIGLARTEHMFLGDRLETVRTIILSRDAAERSAALGRLATLQADDLSALLEVMEGLPVVVRLLDPPLHEFLPDRLQVVRERHEREARGEPDDDLVEMERAIGRWQERNPMLGLRGVRLGLMMPELYRMQVRAAGEAVLRRRRAGGRPQLELMVPLVSTAEELRRARQMIEEELESLSPGLSAAVAVGTLIELPRAALTAGELAGWADFFSFGTNDLTQTAYGLSRDDAGATFLGRYFEQRIFPFDPFQTIDPAGVGRLVTLAAEEGREANPDLVIGVCGEHGGDPASIAFCQEVGMDYVSCSPPRVPAARLAAAQAALAKRQEPEGRTAPS